MSHGLYPIARVHEVGAVPSINDLYRRDGHSNGTSVSIGFPNCQMLYKYRMENPNIDWAILVLHPDILWMKACAFCKHNAADGRISALSLASLMTPQAFAGMYDEIEGVPTREEQFLKASDPTDVQAEVLVFDVIEPQYIAGVIFERGAVRDGYLQHLDNQKTYIHANGKGMFASRRYARKYQQS